MPPTTAAWTTQPPSTIAGEAAWPGHGPTGGTWPPGLPGCLPSCLLAKRACPGEAICLLRLLWTGLEPLPPSLLLPLLQRARRRPRRLPVRRAGCAGRLLPALQQPVGGVCAGGGGAGRGRRLPLEPGQVGRGPSPLLWHTIRHAQCCWRNHVARRRGSSLRRGCPWGLEFVPPPVALIAEAAPCSFPPPLPPFLPAGWATPSRCGWASTPPTSSSTPSCHPCFSTPPSPSTTSCSTRQGRDQLPAGTSLRTDSLC